MRYNSNMQRTKMWSTDGPTHDELTFELERFAWAAPDRLEVAGEFSGVGEVPLDAPILVLRNGDDNYRLAPLADDEAHAPVNGEIWRASFGWQDAPVAFSLAELHMGNDVVIELPEPAVKGPSDPRPRLRAKRSADTSGADAAEDSAIAVTPADAGDPPQLVDELVAAQERLVDVQAVIGRAREEVLVARTELEESRLQSAADDERFRAGLAAIRASADDALALEQKAAEEMQERLAQGDSEIGQLRQSLERAEAERASETAEARSQLDQLRAELEETRQDAAGVRTQAETAEAATAQAQTEVTSLRAHLSIIRAALEDSP